jgi:hypothetical protein
VKNLVFTGVAFYHAYYNDCPGIVKIFP